MKALIAGMGSPILADDGVGIHTVRRLRQESRFDKVDVIELGTAGLSLLDAVAGYDRLIIIDAIQTGAPPGTVYQLTAQEVTRTVHLGAGHQADLPTALALGQTIMGKQMPAEVVVLAIEASNLTCFSEHLTPQVEAAIPEVLDRIEEHLGGDDC